MTRPDPPAAASGAPPAAPLGRANPRLKRLRRLATRRDERDEAGLMIIEGPTLVAEALDAPVEVEHVFHEAGSFDDLAARAAGQGIAVDAVAAGVLGSLLTTVSPQPVVAVARQPVADLGLVLDRAREQRRPVVVLAGVADPGNAGALLRTAEAAGVAGVLADESTVDLYAPKVVRASAGAVLRVPIVARASLGPTLAAIGQAGVARVGAAGTGGEAPDALDLSGAVALVLGNEAHGLPAEIDEWLDATVTIPMAGGTESLNVAAAGAVTLFEAARQRRTGGGGAASPGAAALVSRASHELRSPLTAIKGFTGVLVNRWERLDDDKKRTMVVDVNREADRLARMITELLDLSRIESGRLRLQQQRVAVADLVEASLDRARRDHPELVVTVDLPADLPDLRGDPERLERIVTNLLENSAKYGDGVDVSVTAAVDAQHVEITVADGGPGLAAGDLAAVFDPLAGPAAGRPSGSGLGLWLGRAVARAHGGDLVLESAAPGGTRATLSLPGADVTT